MYSKLITNLIDAQAKKKPAGNHVSSPGAIKKVKDRSIAYSERHRDEWYRPEYDLDEIQIAQDTDSYIFRAVHKKVNRVICAKIAFVGPSPETVNYIKMRIDAISWAMQKPFSIIVWQLFADLFRFSNCMWAKTRSAELSLGKPRIDITGTQIDPVAGYSILPFETLKFKTKANGEIKKIMQSMPTGETKEFFPRDVIHFYTNRKPGFTIGTPELFPALDDIALLRRIEEDVEDLIETNLFPVYHYKVGSDNYPERIGPDGRKETDLIKLEVEYMSSAGVYVSDHRHEIAAIGAEGRALRIDFYITHFKNRGLAGLGVSALDMGEGGTANKSTAGTLSKGLLMDIEAMTITVKEFLEFYVINELLLEGGYNPFDPEQKVSIKFGVIDKDDRRADENNQIQLFHGQLRTMQEARAALGDAPYTEEDYEDSYYKRFEEPAALLKAMQTGSAAAEALAIHGASNITTEGIKKEQAYAKKQAETAAKATTAVAVKAKTSANTAGRPITKTGSKSASASSKNKSAPSNQHGTRSSAKTNHDCVIMDPNGNEINITCDFEINSDKVSSWCDMVYNQWEQINNSMIDFEMFARSKQWRLKE